jgi:hypothetical protein
MLPGEYAPSTKSNKKITYISNITFLDFVQIEKSFSSHLFVEAQDVLY